MKFFKGIKGKKKIIIIIAAVLVVAAIGVTVMNTANAKVKQVETKNALNKTLAETITLTGYLEPVNKEEITLSYTQKVKKIYAVEGQTVRKGDLILELDASDYDYQLQKARISLDTANLAMEKTLGNSVAQQQLTVDNAQSSYNETKNTYEQSKKLYDAGAISKTELDTAKKNMDTYANQLKSAQIQLDDSKANSRQLQNQVLSAKADIENLNKKIDESTIKADFDGVVAKLNVKEEQYPTTENNIVKVYDFSKYKLAVDVSQYDAVSVKVGQKATIKVKGIDKKYNGYVSYLGTSADITMTGTNKETKVKTEVTLTDADNVIKAGYEADTDIVLKEAANVVAVSFEAIQTDDKSNKYVFVFDNGIAKKRIVKTGLETDFDVEIMDGIKTGETYIINPPVSMKDGDKVKLAGGKKP